MPGVMCSNSTSSSCSTRPLWATPCTCPSTPCCPAVEGRPDCRRYRERGEGRFGGRHPGACAHEGEDQYFDEGFMIGLELTIWLEVGFWQSPCPWPARADLVRRPRCHSMNFLPSWEYENHRILIKGNEAMRTAGFAHFFRLNIRPWDSRPDDASRRYPPTGGEWRILALITTSAAGTSVRARNSYRSPSRKTRSSKRCRIRPTATACSLDCPTARSAGGMRRPARSSATSRPHEWLHDWPCRRTANGWPLGWPTKTRCAVSTLRKRPRCRLLTAIARRLKCSPSSRMAKSWSPRGGTVRSAVGTLTEPCAKKFDELGSSGLKYYGLSDDAKRIVGVTVSERRCSRKRTC